MEDLSVSILIDNKRKKVILFRYLKEKLLYGYQTIKLIVVFLVMKGLI